MRNTPVTFVGGPEDGKQRMMEKLLPYVKVAVYEPLNTRIVPDGEALSEQITIQQVEYELHELPGRIYVYSPVAWRDDPRRHPVERVVEHLARGYVGRK